MNEVFIMHYSIWQRRNQRDSPKLYQISTLQHTRQR